MSAGGITEKAKRKEEYLEHTTRIVSSYVAKNQLAAGELYSLIGSVHKTLVEVADPVSKEREESLISAVSVKKSVAHDYVVCLEDGLKFKTLKRHLATQHGMTPEEYRSRWGLSPENPLTAPAYSSSRSELAKSVGLGRKQSEPQDAHSSSDAERGKNVKNE